MLSYTFKNGSVVTGTIDQITTIASVLGEKVEGLKETPVGYYSSASKGLVRIDEMNDIHIKNAINKIAYQFYHDLGKEDIEVRDYLFKFTQLAEIPKLIELFEELHNRI